MPQFKTSKEVFTECQQDGYIVKSENLDAAKVRHMIGIALADITVAKARIPSIPKQSMEWSSIYKLHYDALHQLADAFLRFENVKTSNHQCMFAYLCEKHPELDLDWQFLEKIRTKRNGIQYYGTPATQQDWKDINIQINLYINLFKKSVEEKLENKK